jgi:hypothetical protein
LFSISPISSDEQVVGLCIFNGLSDINIKNDLHTNIYDFELTNPITPRADIVTLTENTTDNASLHALLLRNTVGLYTTEIPQKMLPLPTDAEITLQEPVLQKSAAVQELPAVSNQEDTPKTIQPNPDDNSTQPISPPKSAPSAIITKKEPKRQHANTGSINISALKLDKDIELKLAAAGYITVQDLLPNYSKNELKNNIILNRKSRRKIEARLKLLKIFLK